MRSATYSPQALLDIAREKAFIALDNTARAENFILRLMAFIDAAAASALDMSHPNTDWPFHLRYALFGNRPHTRTIIVEVTATTLRVHRVVGRQDKANANAIF